MTKTESPAEGIERMSLGPIDTTGKNLVRHLEQLAQERKVEIQSFDSPHDCFIATGRLRLHYQEWGNEGTTPIIFLHPGRLNAHSWDLVCLALKGRYRCIALDVPGHGDSEWAPDSDYSLVRFSEELRKFVLQLGIRKFVLVGASQGGLQGLAYALQDPEKLLGLALLDSGPQLSREGVNRQAGELAVFEPQESFENFVHLSMRSGRSQNLDKLRFTLSQNVRQRVDGKWIWKFDPAHRRNSSPSAQMAEIHKLMSNSGGIKCPVLILHGEHSDIVRAADAQQAAARFPNGAWRTISSARHLLHHDNPSEVIEVLSHFIASL